MVKLFLFNNIIMQRLAIPTEKVEYVCADMMTRPLLAVEEKSCSIARGCMMTLPCWPGGENRLVHHLGGNNRLVGGLVAGICLAMVSRKFVELLVTLSAAVSTGISRFRVLFGVGARYGVWLIAKI